MNKKLTKAISSAAASVMLTGIICEPFSLSAMAVGVTTLNVSSSSDIVNAVKAHEDDSSSSVIRMVAQKDITVTDFLDISGGPQFVLDINGKTVTFSPSSNDSRDGQIILEDDASFTVTSSIETGCFYMPDKSHKNCDHIFYADEAKLRIENISMNNISGVDLRPYAYVEGGELSVYNLSMSSSSDYEYINLQGENEYLFYCEDSPLRVNQSSFNNVGGYNSSAYLLPVFKSDNDDTDNFIADTDFINSCCELHSDEGEINVNNVNMSFPDLHTYKRNSSTSVRSIPTFAVVDDGRLFISKFSVSTSDYHDSFVTVHEPSFIIADSSIVSITDSVISDLQAYPLIGTSETISPVQIRYDDSEEKVSIKNTDFINNCFRTGGALYLQDTSFFGVSLDYAPVISDCLFDNNSNFAFDNNIYVNTNTKGGAVYAAGCLSVINCEFTNNKTPIKDNSSGGAIANDSGALIVDNCKFIDNLACSNPDAVEYEVFGGAIYTGKTAKLIIRNSELRRNGSQHSGAIFSHSANVEINNTIIADNYATYGEGACYFDRGTLTITDSVITNNQSNSTVGGIELYGVNQLNLEGSTKIFDNKAVQTENALSATSYYSGYKYSDLTFSVDADIDASKLDTSPENHAIIGILGAFDDLIDDPKYDMIKCFFSDNTNRTLFFNDGETGSFTDGQAPALKQYPVLDENSIKDYSGNPVSDYTIDSQNWRYPFCEMTITAGTPIDPNSLVLNSSISSDVKASRSIYKIVDNPNSYDVYFVAESRDNKVYNQLKEYWTVHIIKKNNPSEDAFYVPVGYMKSANDTPFYTYIDARIGGMFSFEGDPSLFEGWIVTDENGFDVTNELLGDNASLVNATLTFPKDVAGKHYLVHSASDYDKVRCSGASVDISDAFNLNFEIEVLDGTYFAQMPDVITIVSPDGNTEEVSKDSFVREGDIYKAVFTVSSPAKNYADKAYIKIGEIEFSYSVSDYFTNAKKIYSSDQKLVNLISAADVYCQNAAYYFGIFDTAADVEWTDDDAAAFGEGSRYRYTNTYDYDEYKEIIDDNYIECLGTSLLLKERTKVRSYFDMSYFKGLCESFEFDLFTMEYGMKQKFDNVYINERAVTPLQYDVSTNVSPSVLSYVWTILNNQNDDEKLVELSKSLYKFYQAAVAYSK